MKVRSKTKWFYLVISTLITTIVVILLYLSCRFIQHSQNDITCPLPWCSPNQIKRGETVGNCSLTIDSLRCTLEGGKWRKQGFIGRTCEKKFRDAGKKCYSNKDCLSKKCTVYGGEWKIDEFSELREDQVIPDDIYGKCSPNNIHPCFSGEALIQDSRKPYFPPLCD
jgi:hypothetical protein